MYDPQTNVYNPAGNLTTNPLGLNTSVTYNGSATPPMNAGSYAVIATITDPNYTGNTAGTFVIAKATPVAAAGLHRQGKSRAHLPSQMLTAECRGPGRRGGGEFAAETPGREARHQLFFSKAGNDSISLSGTLVRPADFSAAGAPLIVDVGGVVRFSVSS